MAKFRCRVCGQEGTFVYDGRHDCPNCGSIDVQRAIGVEELKDDDPLVVALTKMTDDSTEQT
jgi:Zn finger protein HypA/HybF involved in hydrogenase expression